MALAIAKRTRPIVVLNHCIVSVLLDMLSAIFESEGQTGASIALQALLDQPLRREICFSYRARMSD